MSLVAGVVAGYNKQVAALAKEQELEPECKWVVEGVALVKLLELVLV